MSKMSGMSHCALLIDDMVTRKQIISNAAQEKYGNITPQHLQNIAPEALVFMLVGLKYSWKFPVGYFLTGKSDADANIFNQILFINIRRAWSPHAI